MYFYNFQWWSCRKFLHFWFTSVPYTLQEDVVSYWNQLAYGELVWNHIYISPVHPKWRFCVETCKIKKLWFCLLVQLLLLILIDKYESKHTGSQTRSLEKTYKHTIEQEWTGGRTDRKEINNYTFEWRNPWCHGTSYIHCTGNQLHLLTHMLTLGTYLVQTHILIRETGGYIWYGRKK